MGSIRLSPKHGVNPTIPICFWCGKEKNEIALLGRIGGRTHNDPEAPRNMVLDYEPCDSCRAMMNSGITIMEATTVPNSRSNVEIQNGVYPTGRFAVIKEEARSSYPWLPEGNKAFMDQEAFKLLFGGEAL